VVDERVCQVENPRFMIDGGHTKPVRRPIGGSFLKSLSFIGWPIEAKMEHIVPVLEERLQRRLKIGWQMRR
jgi:hypothetical protein